MSAAAEHERETLHVRFLKDDDYQRYADLLILLDNDWDRKLREIVGERSDRRAAGERQ